MNTSETTIAKISTLSETAARLTDCINRRARLTNDLVLQYKDCKDVKKALLENIRSEFFAYSKLIYFIQSYEDRLSQKAVPYEE